MVLHLSSEAELNAPEVREGRSENERGQERRSRGRTQTGLVAHVRRPGRPKERWREREPLRTEDLKLHKN